MEKCHEQQSGTARGPDRGNQSPPPGKGPDPRPRGAGQIDRRPKRGGRRQRLTLRHALADLPDGGGTTAGSAVCPAVLFHAGPIAAGCWFRSFAK